jgi:prephenate dehydrogenase
MRVAFLGLGLIGGSIARALRRAPEELELVAWTPDGAGPRAAAGAGVVDGVAPEPASAIDGAGLVVLAGPADTIPDLITRLRGDLARALARDATVTDVASTKSRIVATADAAGLPFVGGHPMAGRETSGFAAGDADLFRNRPWVVVPGAAARESDVARVEWLAAACGARPVRAGASDHDAAVAAISHLPLVIAAALAESVAGRAGWRGSLAHDLATTGWDSATRLARGEPVMGAGVLATNAEHTAERLRELRAVLDDWLSVLERTSLRADEVRDRLAAAREALER